VSTYTLRNPSSIKQLAALGWKVTGQGIRASGHQGIIPSDPAESLRTSFREWFLPQVFRDAVRSINLTPNDKPWLNARQLDDLRDQMLHCRNRGQNTDFTNISNNESPPKSPEDLRFRRSRW
jgi:type I restriction enzyme R subunit